MSRGLGPNQKKILKYLKGRGEYGASVLEVACFVYNAQQVYYLNDSQKNSVRKSVNLLGDKYLDAMKLSYKAVHHSWGHDKYGKHYGLVKTEREDLPNYEKYVRLRKRPLTGLWKKWRTKC